VLAPLVAPTERGRSVASEGAMYWLPLIFDARPAQRPKWPLHYKTNSLIISRIIRLELVVRTIGLVVRTIRLIVRTISSPWDPGG